MGHLLVDLPIICRLYAIHLRARSESFNGIGSPITRGRGSLARVAASPPSPPTPSFQHESRSLGDADAALTVDATAGNGQGGVASGGDSSSLKKRARIAYLIMLSGVEELHKTKRLLKVSWIYG